MNRQTALAVVTATLIAGAGAAFAVFLTVSQIEELFQRYVARRDAAIDIHIDPTTMRPRSVT